MRGLVILLHALAAVSCARSASLEPPTAVGIDSVFTLRVGQEARVDGTGLRVRFVGVAEDSRCPTDVACVWAGDARVQLVVTHAEAAGEAFDLHTAREPHAAVTRGYRVELERLEPAPRSGGSIPGERYVAEFRVTRAP